MTNSKAPRDPSEILADYVTRSDLAKQLNKSERTLDRWHQFRIGPPRSRIGNLVIYRRDALHHWLRSQEDTQRIPQRHMVPGFRSNS